MAAARATTYMARICYTMLYYVSYAKPCHTPIDYIILDFARTRYLISRDVLEHAALYFSKVVCQATLQATINCITCHYCPLWYVV